jgi:hypothetical protein
MALDESNIMDGQHVLIEESKKDNLGRVIKSILLILNTTQSLIILHLHRDKLA